MGKLEDGQDKSKYEGFLEEIKEIERSIKLIEVYKSCKDHYNFSTKIYLDQLEIAIDKAIVTGTICSVIAGLAVGGGCFAAGVALPVPAVIGIAVISMVVAASIGLVAGGITYTMLKPSESFNKVDLLEQIKLSEQIYSSLAM